jgi:hypothetical protein
LSFAAFELFQIDLSRNDVFWITLFFHPMLQFINCGIVQDSTKYHAVVAAIESNILSEVSGVIMKTPENDMYYTKN